jgi:hypothetical protein
VIFGFGICCIGNWSEFCLPCCTIGDLLFGIKEFIVPGFTDSLFELFIVVWFLFTFMSLLLVLSVTLWTK